MVGWYLGLEEYEMNYWADCSSIFNRRTHQVGKPRSRMDSLAQLQEVTTMEGSNW